MATTKSGRGRYNGQNIGKARVNSVKGIQERYDARAAAAKKWVSGNNGAYTAPGSRNPRKVTR